MTAAAHGLHLKAVAALEAGDPRGALRLIEKALKKAPGEPALWANLGLARDGLGQAVAAERAYRRALALAPDHPQALGNLVRFLIDRDRAGEAGALARAACDHAPESADAWAARGDSARASGDFAEAADAWGRAFALAPGRLDHGVNAGAAWAGAGDPGRAEAAYRAVLAADPAHGTARLNLAGLLCDLERLEEAQALAEALARDGAASPVLDNTRGNIAFARGRFEEAESHYRAALAADPGLADAWANLTTLNYFRCDAPGAEAAARAALAAAPDEPRHRWQLSLVHLTRGRFAEAWALHAAGFDCAQRRPDRRALAPAWDGRALAPGETLLIWREQGLGDEIRFASLYGEAIARAGRAGAVTIACEPRLRGLFARAFPDASVVGEDGLEGVAPTVQIPAGDLPALFRPDAASFAGQPRGFLAPDAAEIARWRDWLAGLGSRPAIGLNWTGGLRGARRSFAFCDLADLNPLLDGLDARFVALPYVDCAREVAAFQAGGGPCVHIPPGTDLRADLDGAAALAAGLDLVVDVGTSIGDMAGAVGTPVLTVLRQLDEVSGGGDRHLWYPSHAGIVRMPPPLPWPDVWREARPRLEAQGQVAMGGRDMSTASGLPPVIRPKRVPRS